MEYSAKDLWLSVLKDYDINPKYLDKIADYCLMHTSLESYLSYSSALIPDKKQRQSTVYPSIKVLSKLGDYLDRIEFIGMPNFVKDDEKLYTVGTYSVSIPVDKKDLADLLVTNGLNFTETSKDFYERLSDAVANQYKIIIDAKGPIYVYFVISDIKSASLNDEESDQIKYLAASRLVAQNSYSIPQSA